MQGSLSGGGVRVHDHPDISERANRFHGLLQGRQKERQGPGPEVESGGGGEAVSILQQGNPQGEFRAADVCAEGVAVANGDGRAQSGIKDGGEERLYI